MLEYLRGSPIEVYLNFLKFVSVFVVICNIVFKLTKRLTLKYKDVAITFDFFVDTKNDTKDPSIWELKKNSREFESLSLDDFKYFVVNQLYLQIPLSKNDLDNFEKLYSIYQKELPEETIIEKYYQRNYMFNIKFEEITKIVDCYRKTEKNVLKELKNIFKKYN